MNLRYLQTKGKRNNDWGSRMLVVKRELPHNTAEGSEFLDDAIRMIDQPMININDERITADCMDLLNATKSN